MRALIVNSTFYPHVVGGAEVATWLLARALSAAGVEVHALATTGYLDEGPRRSLAARRLDGLGGEILEAASSGHQHLLPREGESRPGLIQRGRHHFSQVHDRRWRQLTLEALDRVRPDVVHTNTIVGLTSAVWEAAAARGIPVVHTLHDCHLLCPRTTLLRSDGTQCAGGPLPCQILRGLKRRHLGGVTLAAAPSRYILDRHASFGFFRDIRREVVPNACDGDVLPYVPPPDDRVRGLFLGRLDAYKGIPVLLDALDRVLADAPPSFGFDFAGYGAMTAEVTAFCARHGDRVRYHGVVQGEAKHDLLRGCAFVVVPSTCDDNFPLTMLDAFQHGRPVIGSRRGGIPEVVRDGETGLIVEPEATPLAAALRRYLDDPARRRRHGEAAWSAAAGYTLARQVDRYRELYGELVNGRGSRRSPAPVPAR